jgi:hypothetical protein
VLRRFFVRSLSLGAIFALLVGQLGSAIGGGGAVSAQSASAIPDTAAYAPADSLAFVSFSLDADSPQWTQASALGERLGQQLSPQYLIQSLLEPIVGGMAADEVAGLITDGELGVAITDPNVASILPSLDFSSGIDPSEISDEVTDIDPSAARGFVLIGIVPSPEETAAAISLFMTSRAQTAGEQVETSTYGDATILSIAAVPDEGFPGIAVARANDAILAATNPDDLKPVIDVAQGSGESLADNSTVAEVLAPLPADRLATAIVNGPSLATYAAGDPDAAGMFAPVLNSVNAVTGLSVSAESKGFQLDLRAAGPDGLPVFGSNDNFDPKLIDQMPADTQILVDGYDFGATGLLDGAVAILANLFFGTLGGMFVPGDFGDEPATPEATPAATEVPTIQESADSAYTTLAFLLGFNLKTELISLLDGEYALGVWGLNGTDPSGASAAFVSETSDPDTLSSSIGTLIGFLGFGATEAGVETGTTRIGGSTVNSITVSSLGLPSPLTIGVVNGTLAIGLGEDGGTVAVEGATGSLADNPDFIAATADLPADRNALLYIDIASLQSTIDAGLGSTSIAGSDGDVELNADALAIAGFQDGDMAGAQGMLYIPES